MKSFWKHVFRSCLHNISTLAGASCIIALGIFIYVAMMDTLENLKIQIDHYYQTSNMADIFAEVKGISKAELQQLRAIQGIEEVSGKMACDVRMLAQGQKEIVTVHLMSFDEDDPLNQIRITGERSRNNTLFLGSRMVAATDYKTGSEITLLINGNGRRCIFQGICRSPEYIYALPPGGAMVPDGEIYDIACLDIQNMEDLIGKKDSYQELGFRLLPGYTYEDVRYQLADYLTKSGLISLCAKEDQSSYKKINEEIEQLTSIGTVLPLMFLSISIFMLFIILKKMIDGDQSIIGTVKAMGMTDLELIGAYMVQGILVGLSGAVIGSIVAIPFGKFMFGMYGNYFNLPVMTYHNYFDSRLKGVLFAVAASVAAVYLGVRGILEITPAQAMRAKAPQKVTSLYILESFIKKLGTMERMGGRSIIRNPFRGILIILAVGFPFSMSSVLLSFDQIADQMFFSQFNKIQIYDIQISLEKKISLIRAANIGMVLDGVESSEGVSQLTVDIRNDNRSELTLLYGLNRDSDMWRIMDMYNIYYQPPDDGIIINTRTAKKLHLKKGDMMEVSCTGLTPEPVKIPVVDIIDESFGSGCYMSGDAIRYYFNTAPIANTILLKVKPNQLEIVRSQLLNTSQVTWLIDTDRILKGYQEQMQGLTAMINLFALMAVVAGGILIYNISMINIRERKSEFGTIVLMGGLNQEIGRILLFEQFVYFFMGILAGIPGSFCIKFLVENMLISDTYSISLVVSYVTYFKAFIICLLITLVAILSQMRVVKRIQIVEVLKERE